MIARHETVIVLDQDPMRHNKAETLLLQFLGTEVSRSTYVLDRVSMLGLIRSLVDAYHQINRRSTHKEWHNCSGVDILRNRNTTYFRFSNLSSDPILKAQLQLLEGDILVRHPKQSIDLSRTERLAIKPNETVYTLPPSFVITTLEALRDKLAQIEGGQMVVLSSVSKEAVLKAGLASGPEQAEELIALIRKKLRGSAVVSIVDPS